MAGDLRRHDVHLTAIVMGENWRYLSVCCGRFEKSSSHVHLHGPSKLIVYEDHKSLQWRHNWCGGVLNHQPHDCLLNRLFRRRSKKISKFRVTGLCVGNSPVTGEFPSQMASNAENVSMWWRHHVCELIDMSIHTIQHLRRKIWSRIMICATFTDAD